MREELQEALDGGRVVVRRTDPACELGPWMATWRSEHPTVGRIAALTVWGESPEDVLGALRRFVQE